MTITTCDICKERINNAPIKVEFLDGTHPHNGSDMYFRADCCPSCAAKIPKLACRREFSEVAEEVLKSQQKP